MAWAGRGLSGEVDPAAQYGNGSHTNKHTNSIGLQYLERDTASRSSVGDASTRLFDHARHLPSLHDTKTKLLLSTQK